MGRAGEGSPPHSPKLLKNGTSSADSPCSLMFPLTNPRAAEEGWGICRAERGAVQGGSLAEYPAPTRAVGSKAGCSRKSKCPAGCSPLHCSPSEVHTQVGLPSVRVY